MPQSTWSSDPANAYAGLLSQIKPHETESYIQAEASAEMPFGRMVAKGTNDQDAVLMAAQADLPIGIVVHSHNYQKPTELGDTGLKPGAMVRVLTKGVIWVQVTEAVTPASAVRYDEAGGTFGDSAVVDETVDISDFARYLGSAGANEFVELEIDMTNRNLRTSDA